MKNEPLVIVRRHKEHKGHHHGGSWKVAYADFVTALMAFFLVMWLVGSDPSLRQSVAAYFRDPAVFEMYQRSGLLPGAAAGIDRGANVSLEPSEAQLALEKLAAHLRAMLQSNPDFAALQDRIEITLTPEGLRIELLETSKESFFDTGSAMLRPGSVDLLRAIARELAALPNPVVIEGHTDGRPYTASASYGNWELSADRANAARRVMEGELRSGQLASVTGYADTRLRYPDDALDPRNRRVSIVVRPHGPE